MSAQITLKIYRTNVYDEVAKATDYTGAKLLGDDATARERILVTDDELSDLARFWDDAVLAANESLKEMLVKGGSTQLTETVTLDQTHTITGDKVQVDTSTLPSDTTSAGTDSTSSDTLDAQTATVTRTAYVAVLEVSNAFDTNLTKSVNTALQGFFIASIIGQWFKLANKTEAADYFAQAAEMMKGAERLLYSRKKPTRPTA